MAVQRRPKRLMVLHLQQHLLGRSLCIGGGEFLLGAMTMLWGWGLRLW